VTDEAKGKTLGLFPDVFRKRRPPSESEIAERIKKKRKEHFWGGNLPFVDTLQPSRGS